MVTTTMKTTIAITITIANTTMVAIPNTIIIYHAHYE